jgi:hypothetical protein
MCDKLFTEATMSDGSKKGGMGGKRTGGKKATKKR